MRRQSELGFVPDPRKSDLARGTLGVVAKELSVLAAILLFSPIARGGDGSIQLFQVSGGVPDDPVGAGCVIRAGDLGPTFSAAATVSGDTVEWHLALPPLVALLGADGFRLLEPLPAPPDGELIGNAFERVPLNLQDEIDAGRVELIDPVPLYAQLATPLHSFGGGAGLQGSGQPGRSTRDNDETPEEKARRLCPDGDCTEFVRDRVEFMIEVLRKQGLDRAADFLQQMLDDGRFVIDFDGDYVPNDVCSFKCLSPELLTQLDDRVAVAAREVHETEFFFFW